MITDDIQDSLPHLSVLVIEDNQGDFVLIEDYLTEKFDNVDLEHCKDFKTAETQLQSQSTAFDLILLDLHLPDLSGIELVNEVLVRCPESIVIILTGYSDLTIATKSLSLGVSDYLMKDELNAYVLFKSVLFSNERKNQKKKLAESEKKFNDLFNLSPVPMCVYDPLTLKFKEVNTAAIDLYGFSKSEFDALTVLDISMNAPNQSAYHSDHKYSAVEEHTIKSGKPITVQVFKDALEFENAKVNVMTCTDITELVDTQRLLQNSYKDIIEIEEEEKQKLASEVHDSLGQKLVAINFFYQTVIKKVTFDHGAQNILDNLADLINSALTECSMIVNKARPKALMENNFEEAIEILGNQLASSETFEFNYAIKVSMERAFDHAELTHIFRIIQELLNNTVKHAKAHQIHLRIEEKDDHILLRFTDDGVGIHQEILNKKSSLLGLKRRLQILNAHFDIKSEINNGTSYKIFFPRKNNGSRLK